MPEQINAGETFANGQQVDGLRLNNHVKNATILKGAITEQVQIESPILASDDKFLVVDTSASTLRQVNASSLVQSNLPVIASLVTSSNYVSQPNQDLSITANSGTVVTGKAFTSVDGINVTITSVAHGLLVNQVITVTASVPEYSGQYRITAQTADTITYALIAAVTASSGTCNYFKNATVFTSGQFVSGSQYILGNSEVIGNQRVTGSVNFVGDVNVTGTMKINGSSAYSLYQILEETPTQFTNTSAGAWNLAWTSTSFTKPADEIWIIELDTTVSCYGREDFSEARIDSSLTSVVKAYDSIWSNHFGGSGNQYKHLVLKYVIPSGTGVTADTTRLYVKSAVNFTSTIANSTSYPSKFRIYKYKTA